MLINGILHSSKRGKLLLDQTMRMNFEDIMNEEIQMKECILYDFIYMKFKNRQKKWNVKEVKKKGFMVGGWGMLMGKGIKSLSGAGNVVCLAMGVVTYVCIYIYGHKYTDFLGGSVVKKPPANGGDTRDVGLIPGSERSPGVGNGNLLQYSCLENSTDRGAWWVIYSP